MKHLGFKFKGDKELYIIVLFIKFLILGFLIFFSKIISFLRTDTID